MFNRKRKNRFDGSIGFRRLKDLCPTARQALQDLVCNNPLASWVEQEPESVPGQFLQAGGPLLNWRVPWPLQPLAFTQKCGNGGRVFSDRNSIQDALVAIV